MSESRIGILTGGGDVPGLNSVIKSVVYRSTEMGRSVVGIKRGWQGLTHVVNSRANADDYIMPLDRQNTRTIDRTGGTILHTSRTNPSRMRLTDLPSSLPDNTRDEYRGDDGKFDLTPLVLENLQNFKIDTLIAIGGDDTLSYAARLDREGFPLMAIPKTMDNDVRNTDYCIGFSTAITRAQELINRRRTTLGSHERVGIFRMFGRDAGFTALYTGYITSARCLIPEYEFDLDRLIDLLILDKTHNSRNYSFVVISEGATWQGRKVLEYGEADAYGHRKKVNVGEDLAAVLKAKAGLPTFSSDLTYDLRSGAPDSIDQLVAITFANISVDLLSEGVTGKMIGIKNGKYEALEIPEQSAGPRTVDLDVFYNKARYRPNYRGKLGTSMLLD
jgi:6-phosphofructokinase 1